MILGMIFEQVWRLKFFWSWHFRWPACLHGLIRHIHRFVLVLQLSLQPNKDREDRGPRRPTG